MAFDERAPALPARSAVVDSVDSLLRAAVDISDPSSCSAQYCSGLGERERSPLIAMLRDEPNEAFRLAERGLAAGSRGIWLRDGSILRLVRAEALLALGKREEAHTAIRDARDRVLRIAATLDDPELRRSYVTGVGANARTLRLAAEWLTQDTP